MNVAVVMSSWENIIVLLGRGPEYLGDNQYNDVKGKVDATSAVKLNDSPFNLSTVVGW